MTQSDFNKTSKNYTQKEELKDLRSQAFVLSEGLTKKFTKLKLAGILLVIQFSMLLLILTTILIKL